MSKYSGGSRLMFDEEEVRTTTAFLPRLIRVIFYGLGITNETYMARYFRGFTRLYRKKTRKELSQKCSTDRKFIREPKLTFSLLQNVLTNMEFEIKSVTIELMDVTTGEIRTFSTSDTIAELDAYREKEKKIGIDSI